MSRTKIDQSKLILRTAKNLNLSVHELGIKIGIGSRIHDLKSQRQRMTLFNLDKLKELDNTITDQEIIDCLREPLLIKNNKKTTQ